MKFFKRWARKSQTFRRIYQVIAGNPSWSKSDIVAAAQEGYGGNPYMRAALDILVYGMASAPPILYQIKGGSQIERAYEKSFGVDAALRGISSRPHSRQAIAEHAIRAKSAEYRRMPNARRMAVKSLVKAGELEEITSHPALDLLARPNGYYQTTYADFVVAHGLSMLLAGEAFYEPKGDRGGAPSEIYIIPPHDLVQIRATDGNPLPGFEHRTIRDLKFKYSPDPAETEIFFAKTYDPVNPLRGLSPLEAALRSIDLNNEARAYNVGFMKNAGVPPMLITGEFSEAEAESLREGYAQEVGGSQNAGRIITLSGRDLKTTQLSIDNAKMLWADTIALSAKEIGLTFGVPGEMLGDGAARTFSNYAEARQSVYLDRILPMLDAMYAAWNSGWLTRFGEGLFLDYDSDQMLPIQEAVARRYDTMGKATWLSIDEKRVATGYEELPNDMGKVVLVSAGSIPLELVGDDSMPVKEFYGDGTGVEDYL